MPVVTRFPPSPTGRFHIGSARTALFNYLFTAQNQGTMYLRFEDTDKARSKKEFEDDILNSLAWLDIPYTMPKIARQSERTETYRDYFEKLLEKNLAYEAEASQGDESKKVIRFRNPNKKITFNDLIHGEISFDTTELGDFIIAKNRDEPLYHIAVVIDDYEMGVTHVIRGMDHVSNTPRQILILEAFGFPRPHYAHIPLILAKDRSKLSKRHGATSVTEYREAGYLPEAMLNYLALLGWNPGDDREYLSRDELIESFDLARVQKGSAIFDETKLLSVNQHWMRALSDDAFLTRLNECRDVKRPDIEKKAIHLLKERAHTFKEAREMLAGELLCLFETPEIERGKLVEKEPKERPGMTKTALECLLEALEALPEGLSADAVKEALMPFADAEAAKGLPAGQTGKGGRGAVLWPLRYTLSGQERSPDPFTLISILGREETVSRIRNAVAILEG